MKIQYDTSIQVPVHQYFVLMEAFSGCIAGREEDGKYFIKVWLMSCVPHLNKILNKS